MNETKFNERSVEWRQNVHMYEWVLLPVARQHKSELFVPAHGSIVLSRQMTHSRVQKEYNQDHGGLS